MKWRIRVERLDLSNNVLRQSQHEVTDEMITESGLSEKDMMEMAFLQTIHRIGL